MRALLLRLRYALWERLAPAAGTTQDSLKKISEAEVHSSAGFKVKLAHERLTYVSSAGRYLHLEAIYVPGDETLHVYVVPKLRWMNRGQPADLLGPSELAGIRNDIAACLGVLKLRYCFHSS